MNHRNKMIQIVLYYIPYCIEMMRHLSTDKIDEDRRDMLSDKTLGEKVQC